LYINIFKNIYMCITYIPKEKRERERERGVGEAAGRMA
jgi:hypothetical protein